MPRLWLSSFDERALRELFGFATPEDELLLLEHVDATNTGALVGDVELGERLDADPEFVADIVRDVCRRGLDAPRPSDVHWRVVDDIVTAVLDCPSQALRTRLRIEGESPDGFHDLSRQLLPVARGIGRERAATLLFDGRRPGRPLGAWPGSRPYFILAREEVGPFANDVRAILEALPETPRGPGRGLVERARDAISDYFTLDLRALTAELLLLPLEDISARDRAVYGRWD